MKNNVYLKAAEVLVKGAGTAKSEEYSEESLKLAEETKNKTFCEPIWVWKKL